jgi:hypothetical protein
MMLSKGKTKMKHKLISRLLTSTALVLLLAGLAGCSTPKTTPVPIEGQERDQILAQAEPLVDNLFQAIQSGDYPAFSKDFDEAMLKGMPESGFSQMMATLNPKIGNYQSRQLAKVEKVGKYVAITYTAKYELEEAVTWRFVLTPSNPLKVSGIWYDSPKLRTK